MLLFALAAYGQQKRIAIINTVDDGEEHPVGHSELSHLTDRLREIAVKILPEKSYAVMTQQSIVAFLGSQEDMVRKCKESEGCLAKLGREINADYVCQGRIGRFGKDLTIKAELYDVGSGNLVSSFTGSSKDIYGLLSVLDKETPNMLKKLPGVSSAKSIPVAGGISGVQSGADDDFYVERRYLANFTTEPAGAVLSFNGMPVANCAKTPCSAEFAEGNVRVITVLDQYETADTTISIKQNNQNINIRLKANFGVLEIKPAYSEGVGKNESWSLTINGKAYSSWENRLSPGKYGVKLSHHCYEDISFDAGINKDSREVFDMASHAKLKKGGLALSAEKDGSPVSEPVFVNGQRVGETPFSGSVAVCSEIGIGVGKEKVDVKLEHKQTVGYVHKVHSGVVRNGVLTDGRDGKKYKVVKIGSQTWMAENLNYDASGSKCYDNKPANCTKYGRLYNWETAKKACPSGWHLPSKSEYEELDKAVGGSEVAGKKLKAKSGWNTGNGYKLGTDEYGFSALPGGGGDSDGFFSGVGNVGHWWSSTEGNRYEGSNAIQKMLSAGRAYSRNVGYNYESAYLSGGDNSSLYSVRCLQDYEAEVHSSGVLKDSRDGKKYKTVKIGNQTWMAENLNYDASGSKCHDNNSANCAKYGRLYNWSTALKACPSGWHLPSKSEYEVLDNAVGGENVAGKKLKSKSGWNDNGNGTDEYGFSALPGGLGYSDDDFGSVGSYGYWWSASEINNSFGVYSRYMDYDIEYADWYNYNKNHLLSVRCVKD